MAFITTPRGRFFYEVWGTQGPLIYLLHGLTARTQDWMTTPQALALEGFRVGELSRGQVSELLDMEFNETERFLKEHGCGSGLTLEEFERDAKRLRDFLAR